MAKIKSFFRNLSFRASFILYVCVALFAAYLASGFTMGYCKSEIFMTEARNYEVVEEPMTFMTEDGPNTFLGNVRVYPEEDRQRIDFLNSISFWCVPLYVGTAVVIAAMLFYRKKMKKPLSELDEASARIAANDLDFALDYESRDEMGRLCDSFEKMRAALEENNRLVWRRMEQRKRLNAAFAHDLRTPLTVLKGTLEMQQTGGLEADKAGDAMVKQIDRLERYVDSMSSMQKMEDMQPQFHSANVQELIQSIRQMSVLVCKKAGKRLDFQNRIQSETAVLDESIVCQVTENLVANAARHAKKRVTVCFTEKDDMVFATIRDDGGGFSAEDMEHATEPYYTADPDRSHHFGLGLYIAKILCRHHGGDIAIESDGAGATVTASFRAKSGE